MIKPIFSPNAKNNMAEIIPILLARRCQILYVVAGEDGRKEQAFDAAVKVLKSGQPRNLDILQTALNLFLSNGSSLRICKLGDVAVCLRGQRYSAIYVQAHKYESPELSHDEFVQLATEHLAESRKSLQERLVATGALEPGAVLPTALIKNAE